MFCLGLIALTSVRLATFIPSTRSTTPSIYTQNTNLDDSTQAQQQEQQLAQEGTFFNAFGDVADQVEIQDTHNSEYHYDDNKQNDQNIDSSLEETDNGVNVHVHVEAEVFHVPDSDSDSQIGEDEDVNATIAQDEPAEEDHNEAENKEVELNSCEIRMTAADYYDSPPVHVTKCVTSEGEELDLEFDGHHHNHRSGDIVNVKGVLGDNGQVNVRHTKLVSSDLSDQDHSVTKSTTSVRKVMVVILQIQKSDGTFVLGTDPSVSQALAATVNNTLFGTYDPSVKKTLAGLWNTCSYNKLSMAYDVDGVENDLIGSQADIFIVTVPYACTMSVGFCSRTYNSATCSSNGNEYYGWAETATNILLSRGIQKSQWQHWVHIYPRASDMGCQFVGSGSVGCSTSFCNVWVGHDYANQIQNFGHEMGHNLGLAHSGDATVAATATASLEYGDFSCAMGYCCFTRCYNAPQAVKLGWLTPIVSLNSASLPSGSSVTINLPSMTRSSNGAISIQLDWGNNQNYWLQYKLLEHYDTGILTGWANVVGVKRWQNVGTQRSDHQANLKAADSWTDPSGQITVVVNSLDKVNGVASVTISRVASVASSSPSATASITNSATASITASPTASISNSPSSSISVTASQSLSSTPLPSSSSVARADAQSPSPVVSRTASVSRSKSHTLSRSHTPSRSPSVSHSKAAGVICGSGTSGVSCTKASDCRSCLCSSITKKCV